MSESQLSFAGQDREAVLCLIGRVRRREAGAFDELLCRYEPMIEHQLSALCSRSPMLTEQDKEDLRQEAHVAFYRATVNYDIEQHEVSFGLYAKICVENGLAGVLRKLRPAHLPLDEEELALQSTQSGEDDPTRRLREKEDYEALCRVISRLLSPYENDIWQRYIAGNTAMEIAQQMGQDVRSVHNAIYRIRHKLRGAKEIHRPH